MTFNIKVIVFHKSNFTGLSILCKMPETRRCVIIQAFCQKAWIVMSYCIHFCIQTHPSSWKFVLSASLFSHLCMLTWCVRAAQSCVTHHQVGRPPLRLRPGVEDKAAYLREKKAREETTWDHRNTLRAVCIYSSVVIPLSAEDICPWSVRHVPIELLLSGLCGLWQ